MNPWWWILLGALLSGPVWVALAIWRFRRIWQTTRRLTARAKGHGQLVELGQLAGGLAHEIKNPLSTINVNLQLLAEDLRRQNDELHRRWLRRLTGVQEEADRLKGILDDFLRYAGKHDLSPQTLDLRRLVEELADFFTPQAEANKVILRIAVPESPVRCEIDENLIKQATLNLMINAVQAMPEGGELLIKLTAHRGMGVLEIIDTGPGIPPDALPNVFQVYYSTKKGGSGLGLPTTRRIVREHGGTIRVESEPGKGTRFVVALPLTKD
jgi:signal transduction histidine kinase